MANRSKGRFRKGKGRVRSGPKQHHKQMTQLTGDRL